MSDPMNQDWISQAIQHGRSLTKGASVSFEIEKRTIKVVHEIGDHIAVHRADGILLATFVYAGHIHYPYWEPVCTPDGATISISSPNDHNWHRGLWMTWKYINGVNFWEGPFSGERSYAQRVAERLSHQRRPELHDFSNDHPLVG